MELAFQLVTGECGVRGHHICVPRLFKEEAENNNLLRALLCGP